MFRKIVIGLALAAIACSIAGSGYAFGKYLKQREVANNAQVATQQPAQE